MKKDIFTQNIDLNVEESILKKTKNELNLPYIQNFEKLKHQINMSFNKAQNDFEYNKNHLLNEALFAIMVTYKELETCIIYGTAKKPSNMYGEWFDKHFNQIFYDAPCSFFSNQAASLSFALGEKIAQFINVLEDINLSKLKCISLFNFSNDLKIKSLITPKNSTYKNSKTHSQLKKLSTLLEPLKDIRNKKIHRQDPEIIKTKSTITQGYKNDNEPITIIMSDINTNELSITPSQIIDKFKEFFIAVTLILETIFSISIKKI